MKHTAYMPSLRYFGGKWKLAPWIISHFPMHSVYVEPFGGAASILLRKQISSLEIYNDADKRMFEFFDVLQNRSCELFDLLRYTPYSREEYRRSFEPHDDPVERVKRMIVRSFQGYGSSMEKASPGAFRRPGVSCAANPCKTWANYKDAVVSIADRFSEVCLECGDYSDILDSYDGGNVLFYCDPPYVKSTRAQKKVYRCEMSDGEHEEMLRRLLEVKGMVVISGYDSEMYMDYLSGWNVIEKEVRTSGEKMGREILFISPSTQREMTLF